MRFLVAEDDDFNQLVLVDMLEILHPGVETVVVPDGHEAWLRLRAESFDAVLTDVDMPVMDGHALLARIRGEPSLDMPVICVTAFAVVGDRERLLMGGFDGYVSKPIDLELLRETLDACLAEGPVGCGRGTGDGGCRPCKGDA
jgi:CheY-like chemotaxis protein